MSRLFRTGPIFSDASQTQPELDELARKERHAHLQAVSHRELVGLHEQVVEQHRSEVDVLQPLDGIQTHVVRGGE